MTLTQSHVTTPLPAARRAAGPAGAAGLTLTFLPQVGTVLSQFVAPTTTCVRLNTPFGDYEAQLNDPHTTPHAGSTRVIVALVRL